MEKQATVPDGIISQPCREGSALRTRDDHTVTGISVPEGDGLDGIRTRGLHVANVTIYP